MFLVARACWGHLYSEILIVLMCWNLLYAFVPLLRLLSCGKSDVGFYCLLVPGSKMLNQGVRTMLKQGAFFKQNKSWTLHTSFLSLPIKRQCVTHCIKKIVSNLMAMQTGCLTQLVSEPASIITRRIVQSEQQEQHHLNRKRQIICQGRIAN